MKKFLTLSFFPLLLIIFKYSIKNSQLRWGFIKYCRFWRWNFCSHFFHFLPYIFMLVLPAFIACAFSDGSCCHVHFKALDRVLKNSHTAMLNNTSSSVTDGRIINMRCQRRVTGTREWSKPCLRISSLLSFQAMHLEGATVNLSVASLIHCLHQSTKTLPERCQATSSWAKHKSRCHKGFMIDWSPFSTHWDSCLQLPCRFALP